MNIRIFLMGLVLSSSLLAEEDFGEPQVYANNTYSQYGTVTVNGEAASAGSVLAVYVGDELRGKGAVIINAGVAYLSILVNTAGGNETASYKLYEKTSGTVLTTDATATISPGGVGSLSQSIAFAMSAPANEKPVADAGSAQSVNEGSTVTLDGSGSSDADSDSLTYSWTAPSGITLSNANASGPTFTAPEVSTDTDYTLSLVVNDGTVDSSASTVVVTVSHVNKAPVAKFDAVLNVNEGETVILDGSNSSDADGDVLTFLWEGSDSITLNGNSNSDSSFTAPDVSKDSVVTIKLTVSDGKGGADSVSKYINIKNINTPPVANAGQSQTFNAEETVILDGSASADGDGDSLTFIWTSLDGVQLTNNDTVNPLFTAPSLSSTQTYTFNLIVNDGNVDSEISAVTITVNKANSVPVANAGQAKTVYENSIVNLDGSGSSDEDGDTLNYAWSGPTGITLNDSLTASPTFTAPSVSQSTDYIFTLIVNDGEGGSSESSVVVSIENAATKLVFLEEPAGGFAGNYPSIENKVKLTDDEGNTVSNPSREITLSILENTGGNGAQLTGEIVASPVNGIVTFDKAAIDIPGENYKLVASTPGLTSAVSDSFNLVGSTVITTSESYPHNITDSSSTIITTGAPISSLNSRGFINADSNDRFPTISPNLVNSSRGVDPGRLSPGHEPVATDQNVATSPGDSIVINLNVTDPKEKGLYLEITESPEYGSLAFNANETSITYSPESGFKGSDSFKYKVTDHWFFTSSATVSVIVNNPPEVVGASVSANEDEQLQITLNGSDVDNDSLSYNIVQQPQNGTLTGSAPNLTYVPNANYNGTDSFTFTAQDDYFVSGAAEISITLTAVNDAPIVNDKVVSTTENQSVDIVLTSVDVEGDNVSYVIVGAPSKGSLSGTAPDLVYTPNNDYFGQDSFTFKASDGVVDSSTAVITISVSEINKTPVSNAGPAQTVDEGASVTLDGSGSSDPNAGDTLTFTWTAPSGVTLSDANAASPTFTAPEVSTDTDYTLSLVVNDGTVDSSASTVVVTVRQVNTPPVANAGSAQTANEGATVTLDGSGSSDADSDSLTYTWTAPSGVTLSDANAASPTFTAPEVSTDTDYTLSLVVNDGTVNSSASTVVVTVSQVNKAPVANAGSAQTVNEGATVTLDGSGSSDGDSDSLTYAWTAPSGVTLSDANAASPTFTAPEVSTDTDYTLSLVVNDGTVDSSASTLVVTVSHVNKVPVANAGSAQIANEGATVTLDGSGSSDGDSDSLTYTWTAPSGVTLSDASASGPTFTAPEVSANTDYTLSLVVNDGTVDSSASTVVVTVSQVNIAPVANAGSAQTANEGATVTLDGSGSSDGDSDSLTYTWAAPSGITLSDANASGPTFTAPEVSANTDYTLSLVVNDGTVDSSASTVVVTVSQVNKAPVASAGDAQTVNEGATVTLDGSGSSDGDSDSLTYTWTAPSGVTLSAANAASTTFTAPEVSSDTDYTLSLVVNDGTVDSSASTVVITVKNVVPVENFGDPVVYANNSASVIGNVTIGGAAATTGSVVAAYVGDELRGKVEVVVNAGTAWLNLLVNAAGGDETVAFKVFDSSTGSVLDSDASVTVSPGLTVGSFGSPQIIAVTAEDGQNGNGSLGKASNSGSSSNSDTNVRPIKKEGFELINFIGSSRNPFTFNFTTEKSKSYTIESSVDFTEWDTVETIQGNGKVFKFTDLRKPMLNQQFFRVREE